METSQSSPPLLRPLPRRPFSLSTTPSSESSNPSSQPQSANPELLEANEADPGANVSRSRSILNLTSSTLFGIYAPTALADSTDTPPTPWGTGAETPIRTGSIDGSFSSMNVSPPIKQRGFPNSEELSQRLLRSTGQQQRTNQVKAISTPTEPRRRLGQAQKSSAVKHLFAQIVLFCFGVAYGALVAQLHDNRQISPITIPPTVAALDSTTTLYLVFWGLAGVGMGNLLPWIDSRSQRKTQSALLHSVGWHDVVRSIGAFVGIAFAIRRVPWETTMQLSFTLALTNPFLWYLLDRTASGFALSTAIGVFGTAALLAINPGLIPVPTMAHTSRGHDSPNSTAPMVGKGSFSGFGQMGSEHIGVAAWIASVLFCSCVCFGNIGRLLIAK